MNKYIIYNKNTGQICRIKIGSKPILSEDESFIISSESHAGKYIDSGELVDIPIRPSINHTFDYKSKEWVSIKSNDDMAQEMLIAIKMQRNSLLRDTDWTQMPDAPLTEQQRTAWAIYRQSLRDVPQNNLNAESIDDIIWPTKPE